MVKVDGISQIVKIPATFSNHGIVHAGSDHFLRKPRWFINIPLKLKFSKMLFWLSLLLSQLLSCKNQLRWGWLMVCTSNLIACYLKVKGSKKHTENPIQLRINSAFDPQCPLSNSSSSSSGGTLDILWPLVGIGPTREFPFLWPLLVMYVFAVNSDISYFGGLLPFG